MRHLLLLFRRDIEKLEYDPGTQYRFHFVAAWFWFGTMIGVPFIPILRDPILSLLIMEASLWANFATHFGAMSSALAAKASSEPPSRQELMTELNELSYQINRPEIDSGAPTADELEADFESGLLK